MAFRFRKSIKIAPGIRVNLNKKSTSIRIGPRGLGYTVSSTGQRRVSAGLPGTGISYSEVVAPKRPTHPVEKTGRPPRPEGKRTGVAEVIAAFLLLFGIASCINHVGSNSLRSSAVTARPASTPLPTATASTPVVTPSPLITPQSSVPAAESVTVSVPAEPAPPAPAETRYVTAASLNIRAGPSTATETIGSLKRGDSISVHERQGDWLRMTGPRPTLAGWVHGDYTSTTRPAIAVTQPRPTQAPSYSSGGGRRYITGPRGGCYYINSNGNKTYVDRSLCR